LVAFREINLLFVGSLHPLSFLANLGHRLLILTSLSPCLARLLQSLVALIKHLHDVLGSVQSPHQHAEHLLLRLWSTATKPLLESLVLTLEELNGFEELFLFACVET